MGMEVQRVINCAYIHSYAHAHTCIHTHIHIYTRTEPEDMVLASTGQGFYPVEVDHDHYDIILWDMGASASFRGIWPNYYDEVCVHVCVCVCAACVYVCACVYMMCVHVWCAQRVCVCVCVCTPVKEMQTLF